jgi:hypothetical protein
MMDDFDNQHCTQRQRIAEVPELEFLSLGAVIKLNRITKAELYSVAGILAMQCCAKSRPT